MRGNSIRFGLVGAGAIGQTYAQGFSTCTAAKLVAVADTSPEAAKQLAARFDLRAFASHQQMLHAGGIDAAVVCTPPATHPQITIDLLKQGVHVLCEKPLAIDVANAQRMADAARRSGATLTMASKFRYVADVAMAKSLVDQGIVGAPVLFENSFTSHVDMSRRWNSQPEISGGGVLIDNGTHSVDLMRYFLGPLRELQVVEGHRSQGLRVEETVRIMVLSQGGVLGNIDLSWSLNKELPTYLHLYGSEGAILVGWKESKYKRTGGEWTRFGAGYDKLQAFRDQLDNFAGHLLGQSDLLISAEDGVASVEAIEAAYEALHRNHWTAIAPPLLNERTAPSAAAAVSG